MTRCVQLLLVLLLAGCASRPPELVMPMLVVGKVTQPRWTNWAVDLCGEGQPVLFKDRVANADCLPHGGELFAAELMHPRRPGGGAIARSLKIAFPGHALAPHYAVRHYMVLQPSTADFRAATGILYVATVRDNYDPRQHCLEENGFGHPDWRNCPDEGFHERHRGHCLPVSEYLPHYAVKSAIRP